MIRKALVTIAMTVGLVAATTLPANAVGWVANSCAVYQALHATMNAPHPVTGNGLWIKYIPCGQGASNVRSVTAGPRPYYVNPEGPQGPFCIQAGGRYYPTSSGAVLTPTVRC